MNIYSTAFFRSQASAYESERAGAGRGVFFVNYLRSLVRGFWATYGTLHNWRLQIRHDDRATEFPYFAKLKRMADAGLLDLIYRGPCLGLCDSMLWRMDPIWNPDSDFVLCRDLDALPTLREMKAVESWMALPYASWPVHSIHDSVSHKDAGLMGGLVGFHAPTTRGVIPRPLCDGSLNVHGDDQYWLNATVVPLFSGRIKQDTPETLGPKDHPMDKLGSHLGGAFHMDPFVKWLDENPWLCSKLEEIRRCEG